MICHVNRVTSSRYHRDAVFPRAQGSGIYRLFDSVMTVENWSRRMTACLDAPPMI
jgi:hypothetical protein